MFKGKWENHSKLTRATYSTWCDMRRRCSNTSHAQYAAYGGRGISVCDRWQNDYDAFVKDMGLRPEGMTIERVDNDGNYEPGNCRWATRAEQNRNTRRSRVLTMGGQTMNAADWAVHLGIPYNTIDHRIKLALPADQILSKKSLVREPQHGTVSCYVSRKCRCDPCRRANAEYAKQRRKLKNG